jgi:cytohesin
MKEGDMYESDILTFMAPRLSGWLWKKSEGTFGQWKRHWFVLTGGCVYYFEAPQHSTPRCIIPLDSVTVR